MRPQGMSSGGLLAALSLVILSLSACQTETSDAEHPSTTGSMVSTSLNAGQTTITNALSQTTTSFAVTTTTTNLTAAASVVIDEVVTEDGWRYQVSVVPLASDPNASPGGCVDTAPPGQTNLKFAIVIENLIEDRSAPTPQFVVSPNLIGDGSLADSGPMAEETIRARVNQNVSEVVPVAAGTSCILASGPSEGDYDIEASSLFSFEATFGPINDDELQSFRGAIRVFTAIGQAVEAEFGVQPGSGEVVGERDLISGDG